MQAFAYLKAADTRQAIVLLSRYRGGAKILAGGTDLLVELKSAAHAPDAVIDIARIAELRGIAVTAQGLRIGALTTHAEIVESPLIGESFPGLAEAARSIGAAQTRNLGTLGGNLMTCVPSMDSGPMLVALDALVTVEDQAGRRQLPLRDMFAGPRKTALPPDTLLIEVVIPRRHFGKPAAFQKFGLRKGQALALVNAAAAFRPGDGNRFRDVRIALGAVAPTVMRAADAEACLEGAAITQDAMAEAGRIAAMEARPITDFRAGAGYRRDLIAALVARALHNAHARAPETGGVPCPT